MESKYGFAKLKKESDSPATVGISPYPAARWRTAAEWRNGRRMRSQVNCICPGYVVTDMNRKQIESTPMGEVIKKHSILKRFGTMEEIAKSALYLYPDPASYMTGTTITIDGGTVAQGVGQDG